MFLLIIDVLMMLCSPWMSLVLGLATTPIGLCEVHVASRLGNRCQQFSEFGNNKFENGILVILESPEITLFLQ